MTPTESDPEGGFAAEEAPAIDMGFLSLPEDVQRQVAGEAAARYADRHAADVPWPPWLEDLSDGERIDAIVTAVAACYGAGDGHHGCEGRQHCTVSVARLFLRKLLPPEPADGGVTAAEALLSLAAEFEAEAEDLLAGRNTGLMDRLTAPSAAVCFRAAARMARLRAGVDPDAAAHAPAGHDKVSHAESVSEPLSAAGSRCPRCSGESPNVCTCLRRCAFLDCSGSPR